jgi:hypothetical protein
MSNPSFPDKIKIGKSKSDPSSFRKDELYTTGVPEPFKVEYFAFVDECDVSELAVHRKLKHHRPNKNREFFTCSIPEAILAIQQNSRVKYEEIFYKSRSEIAEERRKQIERENELKYQEEIRNRKEADKFQELEKQRRVNKKIEQEKKEQDRKESALENQQLLRMLFAGILLAGSIYFATEFQDSEYSWVPVIVCACFFFFVSRDKRNKDED